MKATSFRMGNEEPGIRSQESAIDPASLTPDPCHLTPDSEPERYELREAPRYHFTPDRRDFLKTLGGGIVVCLVARNAGAQQRGGRGRGGGDQRGPQQIGGWLHIAEDGQITLYCGKTEVGQNVRTSVTQAAAEELRVSPAAIRTILADTDLVPDDGGTSGSRSTPSTVPQIRRVAAAARELLFKLASEKLQVDRGDLSIADKRVVHAKSGRKLAFGELTNGQKLTQEVSGSIDLTPADQWQVLGTSIPRVEGRALVTGSHRYTSDVQLPGMLFGRVLRPEMVGAKLKSADLSAAKRMSGVATVQDGEFVGVAAPTLHEAGKAIDSIQSEWTPPESPASEKTLFADLKRTRGKIERNDALEAALKAADHKFEATYTIAYIAHAPLEPRAAVAEWKDGKLTVWTGTQQPFRVRGELAQAFNLPAERVRVIVPDTGSGYGGKHSGEAAVEAARLAKAAGKPVKLVWTREEEFTWAYFRPAGVIDVRAGVSKDGKLVAWDFHNYNSGQSAVRGLYEVQSKQEQFHPSNSPLRQGSYRALASTANTFAREAAMDELAAVVGLDPLEFRLKNLQDKRLRAVFEAAAKQFGWGQVQPTKGRGFGIAGGSEKGSFVATCAEVEQDADSGSIRVVRAVTAFECGGVLHPEHLKNQIEGAVVQGIGGALFEQIKFDGGRIANAAFSEYRVPRFRDTPQLETVLVNRPDLAPLGAGETPIIGIAPAIAAGVFQITGTRAHSLPVASSGIKT